MRYILFFLLTVTLLQAEYLRTIRIGTFPDEKSAKEALVKLQKYAQENEAISRLQKEWDFEFKERASGKYFITLAEPFRDRDVLQEVLDNLRLAYPDIYVTRLKSYKPFEKKQSTSPTNTTIKQEEKKPIQKAPKTVVETKKEEQVEKKEINNSVVNKTLPKESTPSVTKPVAPAKRSVKEVVKTDSNNISKEESKEKYADYLRKSESEEKISNDNVFLALAALLLLGLGFLFYMMRSYKKRYEETELELMMVHEKLNQAEQKLKNKDKIFAHTSHELRSPMTAIIGLSHLLLEESMPQKQKDYVKKIEGSAKYLLDVINDILDVSKMEAGALKIENREFNLNHVIKHVVNIVSVAARENGTRVELDIANNVPPYIVGDSLRLTQILINLLSNAVKFTKNGVVVLGIRKTSQNGDMLTLEFIVRDNGIGMTPAQLKNIFNSYTQASESTAREYGGTGLGLSIVKYLVDIMKGDIHVESKKHHGTTFVLHLKFHTYKEKEKRFYRLPSKEYLNRRVLIVDKSESNINKLKNSFSYFNYTVHTIPSFHDTVLDPNIKFDIVIVNKALVDEQLLTIIKKMKKEHKTKFILFSDSAYELDKKLLEKLDIDEHLSRPFTQEDVLELLKNICNTSKKVERNAISSKESSIKEKLQKLGKRKILIAEDNRLNHKVLSGILSDTEFELVFVEDGKEALEKLKSEKEPFDLILLDINMPNLNGYETAMELRKLENYKETPVLALTADVMQDAINKCYEAGMQGHIAKPIIINSFYEKLYTMLSHEETILLENKKETKKKASKSRSNKKFQELSIENGLEHAHNDEELYKSLLEDFVNMYKDSASELAKLVQSNDFQKARKKALEIKETALHIGAYKLYENVAAMQYEFEKAQRSSSLEMLRYYKESLELLLKEIKAYLN